MDVDFDSIIDRRGGDSYKWNKYAEGEVLPLWVADMDFAAPAEVIAALQHRVAQGVFGYGEVLPSHNAVVVEHLAHEYDWAVEPSWLVWLPGLVCGLNVACRAVGEPGDAVFTATPIYPPFLSAPLNSGRRLECAALQLSETDGGQSWRWDFAAVAGAMSEATRLLLLCHPHNPVGRAWRDDELEGVAELAERRDLVVCSDEIHCGLLLEPGRRHRPYATLSPETGRRSITLMAASKTFNIPGLGAAFAVIPDPGLRRSFEAAMQGIVPQVNLLGLVATEAAYRYGGPWHASLLDYLRGNRALVESVVAKLPELAMAPVEASYLAWIDARRLAQRVGNPQRYFERAGLGLSAGKAFGGRVYEDFVRLNFGCPRATLEEALKRLERVVRAA